MQKLQELLTKHKEKLRDWVYNTIDLCKFWFSTYEDYILDCRLPSWNRENKHLSELLFSTPFLSLLEWEKQYEIWSHSPEIITWWYLDCCSEIQHSKKIDSEWDYRYHKINLALLESDKERVDYISNFTL